MNFATKSNIYFNKTIAITVFCSIIFLLSKNIIFFWDNTLVVSKLGHYMYNNGLFTLNFPDSYDPGHPPLIAFIHALAWKVFGKTLAVSHFVHGCFIFGVVWQLHCFIQKFTANIYHQILATAFVFFDATILAQCFYMGQEVPQMFFFFLAINQIFNQKQILKCVALMFLSLCSVRGMMLCAGVFFIEWCYYKFYLQQATLFLNKKNITIYIVASMPAVAFILHRYITKGFVWYHPNSQWIELAQLATPQQMFKNIIVIAHRYCDFGRIALIAVTVYIYLKHKNKILNNNVATLLLCSVFLSTIIITIISIFITNTIGHRYFAISFVFAHLLCLYIIANYTRQKKITYVALSFILITGNLWQYPLHIAQGWDASLRALPYTQLRNNAVQFIQQRNINLQQVGTFFPNIYSCEEVSLNNNNNSFVEYDSTNKYVLYSNVYNISKQQYQQIHSNYFVLKQFNNYGITIEVLEKNN